MRNEAAVDPKLVAIQSGLRKATRLFDQGPGTWSKRQVQDIASELDKAGVEGLSDSGIALKIAKAKARAAGRDPDKVKKKHAKPLNKDTYLPALIAELKDREKNFATIRAAENAKDATAAADAKAVDDVFALRGELWTPPEESAVDDDVVAGPAF